MPRARPTIRTLPSGRWLTLKSRYQNTRAKVKTTARARAVARIRVKTRAKEREAALPTEASRSSNQTPAWPYGRLPRAIPWTGEGSHQLTAQEISQFGRRGLKPIVFVLNNSGYLIEPPASATVRKRER